MINYIYLCCAKFCVCQCIMLHKDWVNPLTERVFAVPSSTWLCCATLCICIYPEILQSHRLCAVQRHSTHCHMEMKSRHLFPRQWTKPWLFMVRPMTKRNRTSGRSGVRIGFDWMIGPQNQRNFWVLAFLVRFGQGWSFGVPNHYWSGWTSIHWMPTVTNEAWRNQIFYNPLSRPPKAHWSTGIRTDQPSYGRTDERNKK